MAENNINAYCTICGEGYMMCRSCTEQKTVKPWRSVVDSIECYQIYLAIHGYTLSKNKDEARRELERCNLSNLNSFKPEIKAVIEEIMSTPKKTQNVSRKQKADNKSVKNNEEISE